MHENDRKNRFRDKQTTNKIRLMFLKCTKNMWLMQLQLKLEKNVEKRYLESKKNQTRYRPIDAVDVCRS